MFKSLCLRLSVFLLALSPSWAAAVDGWEQETKTILGNVPEKTFTYYEPTYFIFGKDDLKLQVSGKYRLARSSDLYFGFTQTMFWSIYTTSQPFTDINYNPEIFYRLVDAQSKVFKSLDVGFIHSSNGKDGPSSRSFNRLYLKTNLATKMDRHSLMGTFTFYNIISREEKNKDIRN